MAEEIAKGALYVVPTPIGNRADITLRAVDILRGVDFVCAEDTRVSGKLLSMYDIRAEFVSYHEHNRVSQGKYILGRLQNGESAAIVTDAGTPAVSDPGEGLVALCRENGIPVVPLPGACAAITALSGSGFPSRRFVFEGFLPQDKKECGEVLQSLKNETRTVILYEAPHRVVKTVKLLYDTLGDRDVCAARELTKINEEFTRTTLSGLLEIWQTKEPRGEYVLLLGGAKTSDEPPFYENMTIAEHVAFYEAQGLSRMDAMKACASDRGIGKNAVYKALL